MLPDLHVPHPAASPVLKVDWFSIRHSLPPDPTYNDDSDEDDSYAVTQRLKPNVYDICPPSGWAELKRLAKLNIVNLTQDVPSAADWGIILGGMPALQELSIVNSTAPHGKAPAAIDPIELPLLRSLTLADIRKHRAMGIEMVLCRIVAPSHCKLDFKLCIETRFQDEDRLASAVGCSLSVWFSSRGIPASTDLVNHIVYNFDTLQIRNDADLASGPFCITIERWGTCDTILPFVGEVMRARQFQKYMTEATSLIYEFRAEGHESDSEGDSDDEEYCQYQRTAVLRPFTSLQRLELRVGDKDEIDSQGTLEATRIIFKDLWEPQTRDLYARFEADDILPELRHLVIPRLDLKGGIHYQNLVRLLRWRSDMQCVTAVSLATLDFPDATNVEVADAVFERDRLDDYLWPEAPEE